MKIGKVKGKEGNYGAVFLTIEQATELQDLLVNAVSNAAQATTEVKRGIVLIEAVKRNLKVSVITEKKS